MEICLLCKNGYTLENNECNCNIEKCEQCGENICLVCKKGYFYNNTSEKCEKQNKENEIHCDDRNCDICFSELKGACVNCKKGFMKIKGECIKLISVNNTRLCPNNYYSSDGYCLPICEGLDCPIQYSTIRTLCPSNRCLSCKYNELYWWSECDNIDCSSINGCLMCASNICELCNQGYYLLGGLCYKCIKGCSICSNNYTCEYCLSGYELTSDKQCNLTYNFDFDITLYNKYKSELINKNCSDKNCLYCTFKDNIETCEKCMNGYGVNGPVCSVHINV